jgi:hypothetical protein
MKALISILVVAVFLFAATPLPIAREVVQETKSTDPATPKALVAGDISSTSESTAKDIDGNAHRTAKLGNQV